MEAKDAIKKCEDTFDGCVVVDINTYKDGWICRVVPKEYSRTPKDVESDSIFVDSNGKLSTFNPLNEEE